MFSIPERRVVIFHIPTIKGDVFLRFEQASAKETKEYISLLEYIHENPQHYHEFQNYRDRFFEKHITTVIKKKRYHRKGNIKKLAKSGFISTLFKELELLYHKPYKSIYLDKKLPRKRIGEGKHAGFQRTGILSRTEKNLSEYTGTPICDLYDRYTQEEIGYFNDCMTRDYLESFDEGKYFNDSIRVGSGKGLTKAQKEILAYVKEHSTIKSSNGIGRKDKS